MCEIYDFISNNYETGDELFFFGFSRGAFTVRSVAGLVCDIGVLSAVHMSSFPEMWQAYRTKPQGEPFQNSDWYQVNQEKLSLKNIKIKVIGVWDTVGALVRDTVRNKYCFCTTNCAWLGNSRVAIGEFAAKSWHPNQQAICIP